LAASVQSAPPFYEVRTGKVKGLGMVLVDGQGLTLYLFVPDKRSGRSTCYKLCAEAWPPLRLPTGVTRPVAGRGIKASLLGTTHRTDGTSQVTYHRWPLYLWVGDSEPGQATGQGINNLGGLWYVLSPDGNAITAHP
jgi:predicted lipoprotein with Yx(FWY)xxD motif